MSILSKFDQGIDDTVNEVLEAHSQDSRDVFEHKLNSLSRMGRLVLRTMVKEQIAVEADAGRKEKLLALQQDL